MSFEEPKQLQSMAQTVTRLFRTTTHQSSLNQSQAGVRGDKNQPNPGTKKLLIPKHSIRTSPAGTFVRSVHSPEARSDKQSLTVKQHHQYNQYLIKQLDSRSKHTTSGRLTAMQQVSTTDQKLNLLINEVSSLNRKIEDLQRSSLASVQS
jgi:hypothetical protein